MLTWDVSTGLSRGRSRIEEGQTPALVPSFIKSGAAIRAGSVQMKSRSLLLQRKHGRDFTRIYPRMNRYQADSRVTHNNISDYETHQRESIKKSIIRRMSLTKKANPFVSRLLKHGLLSTQLSLSF